MSEVNNSEYIDDQNLYFNTPVVRLKEGLPLNDLLSKHQTEFEVKPDEDEDPSNFNSAESCFNFKDVESELNLNLGFDQEDEEGSPFDKYRKKMTSLRDDNKILKYVLKGGTGPQLPEGCIVYIRYKAYTEYESLPFDSTVLQSNTEGNLAVGINLGKGELLPGLHEAVLSMRKGEKSEFLIHPDLAYGKLGCPPRIPQDATILFEVEIDRFVDCGDIHMNNDDLSMEERNEFCNVYKIAKSHYLNGNDLFKQDKLSSAVNKYKQVINMMHNARLANEEEEKQRNHFLVKNYSNACICYHKIKNYKRVCIMASDAARVSSAESFSNAKLLYFWGYAKMMLGDYEGSRQHLMAARKLDPSNQAISEALSNLQKKKIHAEETEKMMLKKAFGFERPEVKISEIDEDEENFKRNIRRQLQEFKNNPNKESLILKDPVTVDEGKICIQVAKDMDLYARVAEGERRIIHFKKP